MIEEMKEKILSEMKHLTNFNYNYFCFLVNEYFPSLSKREIIKLETLVKGNFPESKKLINILGVGIDLSEEKVIDNKQVKVTENEELDDLQKRMSEINQLKVEWYVIK